MRSYCTRWLGLKQALYRPHSPLSARERPLAGSPARAAGKGLGGVCERARPDWIQRHYRHRAVAWSYRTRWLGPKQALQRSDPTATAKERLCGRCASRKSAAPCPLLLSLVSQRISVIPSARWQSLCCTVLRMHRYIAETLSMSTSERPTPIAVKRTMSDKILAGNRSHSD